MRDSPPAEAVAAQVVDLRDPRGHRAPQGLPAPRVRQDLPVRVVRPAPRDRLLGLQVVRPAAVVQVVAPVAAGTQVAARSDVEEW